MAEGNAINVGSVEVDVVPTAKGIDAKLKAQTDPAAAKAGKSAGSKFSDTFKAQVDAALKSLPDAKIGADATGVDREIEKVRAELESLSNVTVGVDISDDDASAKIDALQARLAALGQVAESIDVKADIADASAKLDEISAKADEIKTKSASINVNADTAAADANMAATAAEADDLGHKRETINVDADTGAALSSIITLKGALIGVAAISLAPLAAGAVALAGPLAAAGAGFAGMAAVAVPAITDIKNAMDAQKKAAGQVQAANTALANANAQVASAQQSVSDAQRSADQQAIQSAEAVTNARQTLADAEKQQARDAQTSARAVAQAEQQAAQQRSQALQQVAQAENTLKLAQQSEKDAQNALTQARKDAADQLKQLEFQTADQALNERSAKLQVEQAKQALDATNANKKATGLQRQQAKLNYDEAVQQLKEQQYQTKQLAAQKADADKKGIKGADNVVKAQQNLSQAQQDVADKQKALVQAQQNVVKVQVQGAQAVADAEQKAAQQRQDDAERITKAEQGVSDALRNQQFQAANSAAAVQRASSTLTKALAAQQLAQDKADKANAASKHALDNLTPSEKKVADGFETIKNKYKDWAKALGPKVLPTLTGGMTDLNDVMGLATPVIGGASGALQDLEKKADDALKSKFWKQFAKFMGPESRKAVSGFGKALGSVATGLAGFLQGVSPLGNIVLSGLDQVSKNFANWGKNFAKNGPSKTILKSFQDLQKPMVGLFSSLGSLIGSVFKALLPLSVPVIQALKGASDALGPLVQQLGKALLPVFQALAPLVKPLVQVLGSLLVGAVKTLSLVLVPLLDYLGKHTGVFKALTLAAVGFFIALKIASATSLGPWSIAIAAVIIGIVELVQHWNSVKHVLLTGWNAVANFFTKTLPGWFMVPIHYVEKHWRGIAQILVSLLFGPIPALLWKYWGPISNWFLHLPGRILAFFKSAGSWLVNVGKDVLNGLWRGIKWIWDHTINSGFFAHIAGKFRTFFSGAVGWLEQVGKNTLLGLWHGIKWVWDHTIDNSFFAHIAGKIGNFFKGAGGWLTSAGKSIMGGLWGGLKSGFKSIQGWFTGAINWIIKNVINKFIGLLNKIPGVSLKTVGTIGGHEKNVKGTPTTNFNAKKQFAHGGVLPGYSPGRDTVPVMASPGEGWLVPEAVQGLGPGFVHWANDHFSKRGGKSSGPGADSVQKFSFGGIVKDIGKFGKYTASKIKNVDNAVDPLHLVNHVFDGAVNLAAKTARGVIGSMPFGDAGKAMAKGVIGAVQNAVLHDGHADTKKTVGDGSGGGGDFISYASQFLGQPYVWGGDHPGGFDCSGLTSYVMDHFGLKSPRTASAQEAWSKPISQSAALPGDLVFYGGQVGKGGAHHVAFYDGNNKILEAQQTGVPLLIDAYRKGGLFGRAPGASKFLGGGFLSGLFGGGDGKIASGSKGQEQNYAKSLFGRHGWAANQLGSLISLWNGESGWNPNAQNPGSTAYGIAQFLNSTWKNYGPKTANWKKQIEYGEDYIDDSYGTPSNAFAKWSGREPHWYGSGLSGGIFTKPTLIGVGDGGPERVDVTPLRGGSAPSGPMRIQGTLDMGNGLTGFVDGLIDSHLDSVARQVTHGRTP